jgi:putative ABC transport system permease protein
MDELRFALPLAWRRFVHQGWRAVLAAAGIGFAALLICMQIGFLNALFDAQVQLVDALNGDLFITSSAKYTLVTKAPFASRRIEQAAAVPGVASVSPLLIEYEVSAWRNPDRHIRRSIRVLGVDPADKVFRDPDIDGQLERLRLPDTVLVDEYSKPDFGSDLSPGTSTELGRHTVVVVGSFRLGTDFVNDANAIMGRESFLRLFPHQRSAAPGLGRVELGIVTLEPGVDPARARSRIAARLPDDVEILTRQQLIDRELAFWRDNTPIGSVFLLGAAMGFIIGSVICYQILFTDVVEHLPQFGTLMAMGFDRRRIVVLVLLEAVLLACAGLVPALILGETMYGIVGFVSGLPMHLTPVRAALVSVATVAMCLASGYVAVRRALRIDPAELFA